MTDVDQAISRIARATHPSDLFGIAGDDAGAKCAYRQLARLVHPDRAPGARAAEATSAFTRLTSLWAEHRRGGLQSTIMTRRNTYTVRSRLASGEIADLFGVSAEDGQAAAVLRVPRDPTLSDLLEREAVALGQLAIDGDPRLERYSPRLLESFFLRDAATGVTRRANVIEQQVGFCSLAEVMAAYPDGVDPRDAAWIWRRLLVALGNAHRAGVIHGAVLPEHVLIHPRDHGLVLVDWCYSVSGCYAASDPSGVVPALVRRYAESDFYPHEVLARKRVSPPTDIFMATRCMAGAVRDRLPHRLRQFADGCTLRAPDRRPADAWRLLAEFDELLERLYGPRRFRPFVMPEGN